MILLKKNETARQLFNKVFDTCALDTGIRLLYWDEKVNTDLEVSEVRADSRDGNRIYEQTIIFLLSYIVKRLFPDALLRNEHSISWGSYVTISKRELKKSDVANIERELSSIIGKNVPIFSKQYPLDKAKEILDMNGYAVKAELLRAKAVFMHKIDDYVDWFDVPLLPSTGMIKKFELIHYPPGMIVRIPLRHNPEDLPFYLEQPKLFLIFSEHELWAKTLGVSNIISLNKRIKENMSQAINVSEAFHEKKLAYIADSIIKRPLTRLILIAGPSSSGKTTFSKRLSVALMVNGVKTHNLSTDDFFKNRENTPIGEDGKPDYEALEAVHVELFNDVLMRLFEGEKVEIPRFDFKKGKRIDKSGRYMKIERGDMIIVEGIHGLNPDLTRDIPSHLKFKIYVSALTQLNFHEHEYLKTNMCRLVRRIVRDSKFRGYNAEHTLLIWDKVRAGEEKYVFPYQENADIMFNSSLLYEQAVLKKYALPLLREVDNREVYSLKRALIKMLDAFDDMDDIYVPSSSILREFIGGSCFGY